MYLIFADIVTCIHFTFVFFVVFGGLFYYFWANAPYLHLPAVFWGLWIELSGSICPLTPLENWLDQLAGGSSYRSSFIEQYITQFLYPTDLTQNTKYYIAIGLAVFNLIVYIYILRKKNQKKNMSIHDRINAKAEEGEKKSFFYYMNINNKIKYRQTYC